MSSSLDAVKEDLKEVQEDLQSAQDPADQKRLRSERRQLRAELRRLQESPGQGALDSRYARAEDVDALKEAIHKKPRVSITLAETYQEQGRRYLEKAEILPHLDGILVALNPDHATALADAVTADVLAAQTASRQAPVQQLMVALANEVQGLVHLPGRCYVDTSRTGLPLLPAGRLAKPDLAGCEGHPSASAVSIINEAKPSLATPKYDQEAAYQVVQRALQLQVQQPQRSKWVFASLGRDSVRIFLIETDAQGVRGLQVTHPLPLFAAAHSPGLAAMLRLHSTPADHLGWLPDLGSMPSDLSLDGQRVGQLYNIMPTNKPATRSAQVVAGVVGGVNVYCKTSSSIESEIAALQQLRDLNIPGIANLLGQCVDGQHRRWLIATPVGSCTLRNWTASSAELCTLMQRIAVTVGELADRGLHHSDLSPSNILPETATLIDLQTLSTPGAFGHEITFTLQFVAQSRLVAQGKTADLATELESLMYCFLFVATKDQLHWKHCDDLFTAWSAKAAAMCTARNFGDKVLPRINEPELRGVARRLQNLFDDGSEQIVGVQTFQACFSLEGSTGHRT